MKGKKGIFVFVGLMVLLLSIVPVSAFFEPVPMPIRGDASEDVLVAQFTNTILADYVEEVTRYNAAINLELSDIVTTITFSQRLTASEVEDFISAYNISPVVLESRGFDADGARITGFSLVDDCIEESEKSLRRMAEARDVEFAGFISIQALVDATEIYSVQTDSRTFLTDTSGDLRININPGEILGFNISDESGGFSKSLAWELEDLGLVW